MVARLQRRLLLAELLLVAAAALILLATGAPGTATLAICLALPAAGRLTWVTVPAFYVGLTAQRPCQWLRSLPGEWLAFSLLHSLLQPARPLWRHWLSPPSGGDGRDVLFVHGYCCNAAYWLPLRWRLRGQGLRAWHVDLEPPFADIDALADQLAKAIDAMGSERRTPLLVVAHSMGGLVTRAALADRPDLPIATLITLGTPHAGTSVAHLAHGRNAAQMRPRSRWLARLPKAPQRVYTIAVASTADELVQPTASALPSWADEPICLANMGHIALGWSSAVARLVVANATNPSGQNDKQEMPR